MKETTESKIVAEVKQTVEIPSEMVFNLLVNAIEGGSNEWAETDYHKQENKSIAFDYWQRIPLNGGTIDVYDAEGDNDLLGTIDLKSIQTALQLMANGEDKNGKAIPERHWDNFISENDDAETADVFLQLAVMGEIVFC